MDLTGCFLYWLLQGHECVLVVYDCNINAILAEPLTSRKAGLKEGGQ